jgi:valyl-tRNA synthetase
MKFIGEKPFDDVITTAPCSTRTVSGCRRQKQRIDPLDVFAKYGVDATRWPRGSATGVDFAWRDERVESFRNFANKIWNATRFALMNSDGHDLLHFRRRWQPLG